MKYVYFSLVSTYFLVLGVLFLFVFPVHGQSSDPFRNSFISPEAAALYTLESRGLREFSGTLDLTLPLVEVRNGDVALQLGLSYDSGGNRVESIAPWTGLGWSISGLPRISRQVRGIPDETTGGVYYLYNGKTLEQYTQSMTSGEELNMQILINQGELDTQSDVYFISIPGYSGKFYWDQTTSEFVTEDISNLKVTFHSGSDVFSVTDENGIHYAFDVKEYTQVSSGSSPATQVTTSWLASEISYPGQLTPIQIGYQYQDHSYHRLGQQSKYLLTYQMNSYPFDSLVDSYPTLLINSRAYYPAMISWSEGVAEFITPSTFRQDLNGGKYLSEIQIMDRSERLVEKIQFAYSYYTGSGETALGSNKWLKLDQLTYVNLESSAQSREFGFTYASSPIPPSRLSYAQDYWGFYNGKTSNPSLIPSTSFTHPGTGLPVAVSGADRAVVESAARFGILTRLTYPTKGYTEYVYESNRVNQQVAPNAYEMVMAYIAGEGGDPTNPSPPTYQEFTTTFVIDNPMDQFLNGNTTSGGAFVSADVGALGVTPGSYGALLSIRGLSSTNSSVNFTFVNSFSNQLLPNGTYELKGVFDQNPPNFWDFHCFLEWYKVDSSALSATLVGGMRIRETKDFDHTGTPLGRSTYRYVNTWGGNASSGKLFGSADMPFGSFIRKNGWYYNPELVRYDATAEEYYRLQSHPVVDMITQNSTHVGYGSVFRVQYSGADSVVTHRRYSLYPDEVNPLPPYVPVQPQGALNGKLLEDSQYSVSAGALMPVRRQTYTYDWAFDGTGVYNFYTLYYDIHVLTTPTAPELTSPENYNLPTLLPYHFMTARSDLQRDSLWEYASGHSPRLTVTSYQINSHRQLVQSEQSLSDGSIQRTVRAYPNTMSYPVGENETARLWQLNNNEYNRVLRTERSVIKGGTTEPIETNTLYFKQFGASANSVYLQRAERRKGSQLLEQTRYDHYNAYGNPQQVQQQERAPTVYLWGYGGQYPVARIEHATFAQVQSALGGGTAATAALNGLLSPTVTDGFIQSTLETVRMGMVSSRVSSFHYRPLVGISGMTGARGLAEYYHYDGLGRLKLMLDFQQYVRYRYDYHFKP